MNKWTHANILNLLDHISKFFEKGIVSKKCLIFNWNEIPKEIVHGVYIIKHKGDIVYVGKGRIRDRQKMHIEKLTGAFKRAEDTVGFKMLRESDHYNINAYNCQVYYFDCHSASAASAIEGSLIHFLQPLANKETFQERHIL